MCCDTLCRTDRSLREGERGASHFHECVSSVTELTLRQRGKLDLSRQKLDPIPFDRILTFSNLTTIAFSCAPSRNFGFFLKKLIVE
jgi:hypothetical protein